MLPTFFGVLATAAIIAVAVVAENDKNRTGRAAEPRPSPTATTAPTARARRAIDALRGIPQVGGVLGSETARARLVIFAEVDSPSFARFDRQIMPELINRYVDRGRIDIQLRTLLSGRRTPDTAEYVQAAGLQSRLWQFVRTLTTGDYRDPVQAARAAGLDAARLRSDASSSRVQNAIAKAERLAKAAQVRAQPAFRLTTVKATRRISASRDSARFTRVLDRELGR